MPAPKEDKETKIPITEQDIKEKAIYYSTKTSDIVRQLCIAGLAISWLFFYDDKEKNYTPKWIVPIALFILAIVVDLLQYSRGTTIFKGAVKSGDKLYTITKRQVNIINNHAQYKAWIVLLAYLVLFGMIIYEMINKS